MAEGISHAEQPIIFISYRRADSGWAANLLASSLQRTFGVPRVFCDVRGIDAGDDFAADLEEQLHRASVILVLIGGDWLRVQDQYGRRRLDRANDWVRREIRDGLERRLYSANTTRAGGCRLPAGGHRMRRQTTPPRLMYCYSSTGTDDSDRAPSPS